MLTQIEDVPESITGFVIHGALRPEDFQTELVPALEARSAVASIRLLLVTGSDFLGADIGATMGGQHFRRTEPLNMERIAIATDNSGFAQAIQMFAMLSHSEVKVFNAKQQEDAIAWLLR